MARISSFFDDSVSRIPSIDLNQIRKARRVEAVRNMWRGLVSPIFLEHTNSVFVFDKDGRREMHVYVDDSLFAAELNAQREIIKWRCLEEYGEAIDDFFIHVSRGSYKDIHPFSAVGDAENAPKPLAPLSASDEAMVEGACSPIEDEKLKKAFKDAMISDLTWKKSEKR